LPLGLRRYFRGMSKYGPTRGEHLFRLIFSLFGLGCIGVLFAVQGVPQAGRDWWRWWGSPGRSLAGRRSCRRGRCCARVRAEAGTRPLGSKHPDIAPFDDDRGQRAAIGGGTVDVHAVAVMGGIVQRGMAVHDEEAVIAGVFKKAGADPDQIGFMLLRHRDARADARMNKDAVAALQPCGAAFKEDAVRSGGTASTASAWTGAMGRSAGFLMP
jgi:hypothetical protein